MSAEKIDLYNTSYGSAGADVYSEIRRETYGEDLGQTSWATLEEFAEIPGHLNLTASSNALDIGCGAGGCALRLAASIDCHVTGIDANAHGIRSAEQTARTQQLADRTRFLALDAGSPLPFADGTFDAAYSNDAFCHIPHRHRLLMECRRILKPGGRLLFSDALVVNGAVTNEELAARSSIGYYVFVPRGENERLIAEAGLKLVAAKDTTPQAAIVAQRWRDARASRRDALVKIEGENNFEGLQTFLRCVQTLTAENRLARFLYIAAK
ncbi:MAG TPA: methyltransferase domain-containing protein [Candidatus Acidoferrales bacterium]|nr:methyltransferase domain-containing protein [Candidatus Acidoferrales bacterium]